MDKDISYVRDLLRELVSVPTVTGNERAASKLMESVMAEISDLYRADEWSNFEAVINPGGSPKVMIAAHIDQIGIQVTEVTEKGYVKIAGVGGWDAKVAYGMRFKLLTEKGELVGVINTIPPHVFRARRDLEEKKWEMKDLTLDLGVNDKKKLEEMGVVPGVYGVPAYELIDLPEDHVSGPGLDDKSGVATMLLAGKYLWEGRSDVKAEVHLVATVQEEIGLRGAKMTAFRIKPDYAIALDVTLAKQPMLESDTLIELDKGPAISKGPIYHWEVVDYLIRVAKEEEIPYQIEPDPRGYGTDTWMIQVSREGVKTGLVSIPLRNMHSPVEVISLKDVVWSAKLVAEFITRLS